MRAAVLIGVDLGPQPVRHGVRSPRILWLTALRREGLEVGTWAFLKLGALVMPPALLLALAAALRIQVTAATRSHGAQKRSRPWSPS